MGPADWLHFSGGGGGGEAHCQGHLIFEGNRYFVVVEDLYVVVLDLFRRVPSVNTDGLILDKPW